MSERMNKERAIDIINTEVIDTLKSHQQMSACFDYDEDGNAKPNNNYAYYDELLQALDYAINCVGAIEQIKRERDIAISQLNELGYQFGEKIKPDEHKTIKELRTECEEYLDRDLSPEKRCKTVREMTPREWLEEIIYSYGNGYTKPNRIYICSDLFILLQKIEKMENEK